MDASAEERAMGEAVTAKIDAGGRSSRMTAASSVGGARDLAVFEKMHM
jgi:hypothetical protein